MKKLVLLILLGFSAVIFPQPKIVAKLLPTLHNKIYPFSKNDTLKILAVMVEFQPDRYDATFGDGTFGSIYTGENRTRSDILDPLPHDKTYFENHLRFVKNYFEKESFGKLNILYSVLPDVVTLDNTMRNYSPEVNSTDLTTVANLTKEAWQKVYQLNPNFDFSGYDMFVVFHAGVGLDVSVPGSLGLERDIPSVFLGIKQYREIYGDDFEGIQIGDFNITNSAVLPETESREVAGISGTVLIELTINGLLASMVGSYLGLPDLYNTETGYSAIGRFGLMDGQAIFAYGGAFPPSLSPFEKMLIGWLEPVTINSASEVVLSAEAFANINDLTVVKLPINQNEYFLVQVRNRDANKDGAKIHYVDQNGTTRQVVFENDTTGFYSYDVSALQGIIVNVDEPDWALPGSGIVIWHIDENKVREGIENNTVNNDINHRGVAVVEADGITDIGKTFYDIFGDLVVGEGTAEDFWFDGNNSHYYQNKFTPETKPNSNSYYGASSNIYLSSFSPISPSMSFSADLQGEIEVVSSFKFPTSRNATLISASTDSDAFLFAVQSGEDVFVYDFEGNLKKELSAFSSIDFLMETSVEDSSFIIYGAKGNTLFRYSSLTDNTIDFAAFDMPILKIIKDVNGINVLIGNGDSSRVMNVNDIALLNVEFPFSVKEVITEPIIVATGDSVLSVYGNDNYFPESKILKSAFVKYSTRAGENLMLAVLLEEGNRFEIIDVEGLSLFKSFYFNSDDSIKDFSITLSEFNQPLISFAMEGKLYSVNLKGAVTENFPFEKATEVFNGFSRLYVSSQVNKNVTVSDVGNIYFYSSGNDMSLLNPLFTVGRCNETPNLTICRHNGFLYLLISDSQNNFYILRKDEQIDKIIWSGKYPSENNSEFINTESTVDFGNESLIIKAYNWPNPVSEGVTHFRVLTPEDAKVNIKIFDLSGMKIDEISSNVSANIEQDINWNVNNVQSDVYFAHVEVTLNSGRKDFKIIKVAVIK